MKYMILAGLAVFAFLFTLPAEAGSRFIQDPDPDSVAQSGESMIHMDPHDFRVGVSVPRNYAKEGESFTWGGLLAVLFGFKDPTEVPWPAGR